MSTPSLNAGENPTADSAAAEHVKALLATGMAYEFQPETIATRAFLDGFALGAADLARVTAENARYIKCINKSESVTERGNLVGEIKRLEAECERLERRRQFETDLVCAAILEANAGGVHFGSAELCKRVDEQRQLRANEGSQLQAAIDQRLRAEKAESEVAALRARVAELEPHADAHGRLQCVHAETCRALAIQRERNAELVAALREIESKADDERGNAWELKEIAQYALVTNKLARAESATPEYEPTDIRMAQVEAGENSVIAKLRAQGLA